MKVLALVHKYPPVHNAGAEVMLHAMLVDLARRGHECIVTYPKAPAGELDGIPIVPTPPMDTSLVNAAAASDVIITHLDVTPRAMRVARAAGRPLVHLVHNDGQLPFHGVTADRADLVVWNSEWIAAKYEGWAGPTVIVRPPVTLADYELEGLPVGKDITLVNLTQAKGALTFYALAEAERDRTFLGVRGAYGTQVAPERRRRNLELLDHVPSSRMRDIVYARTRILLVPSSYESWGRVAIEASAAGIPVIAAPTPGLLESLGPEGLFADHGKPGDYARIIKALDDPDYYRDRSELGRARARELERVAAGDLDRFALRLEEVVAAYDRPDGAVDETRSPMAILSSATTGGRQCPVCGARNCACGSEVSGVTIARPGRRGLPLRTYATAGGQYRLNDDTARQRGLLPDGPELPLSARRLLNLAGVEVAPIASAYARADDDARAAFLAGLNAVRKPALADKADELLEALLAAPPAPEEPEEPTPPDPAEELRPNARVGEVLAWAGEDPERIAQALEAERAGQARPTLIAELERLLSA